MSPKQTLIFSSVSCTFSLAVLVFVLNTRAANMIVREQQGALQVQEIHNLPLLNDNSPREFTLCVDNGVSTVSVKSQIVAGNGSYHCLNTNGTLDEWACWCEP